MNIKIIVLSLSFLLILILVLGFLFYKLYFDGGIEHYQNKQLHFIHIPKNAGTTIENLAKDNGILWGRFDKEYNNEGKNILDNTYSNKLKLYNFNEVSPWHNYFPKFSKNYKNKYDWFVIVRNPYKWILSHGHYWIKEIEHKDINKWNKEQFNEYIRTKISEQRDNPFGGHYCPQYKFIENNENVKINIIKMENLQTEFNNLMEKYNINIKLNRKDNTSNYKFKETDLDESTIKLIQEVYKKDFELFNYDINNLNVEYFDNKNTDIQNYIENNTTICIKTMYRQKLLNAHITDIRKLLPNIKIIISDDSDDEYKVKNKKVISKFKNIEYIALPYDSGLSKGRNEAVKNVNTKYTILTDDSRVITDIHKIYDLINFLDANFKYSVICSNVRGRDPFTNIFENIYLNNNNKSINSKQEIKNILKNNYDINVTIKQKNINELNVIDKDLHLYKTHVGLNCFIARTDILKKYPWDNMLKLGEHKHFFFKLFLNNINVLYCDNFISKQYDAKLRTYDNNGRKLRNRHNKLTSEFKNNISFYTL